MTDTMATVLDNHHFGTRQCPCPAAYFQAWNDYYVILLCLMPDDFTHQGKSATTQWVNQKICQCILLTL